MIALLIDQNGFIAQSFSDWPYLAPFLVLLACGLGLPLPEEVTLIGSGLLLHRGQVEFLPITVVCATAILIGDSVPFWLGRRFGMSALRIGWVKRIVHPERFSRLERRFEEHGNQATFACRFFAGIRIPGYFLAGTMGMRYPRFLLLDALGVLISVPVSIYLGLLFGSQVQRLKETVGDLHLILAFLVLAMVLTLFLRSRTRGRGAGPRVDGGNSGGRGGGRPAPAPAAEPPGVDPASGEVDPAAGEGPDPIR